MCATTPFLESSEYLQAGLRGCHSYVLPDLLKLCSGLPAGARVLDVGCGNGSVAAELERRGFRVTGIDLAEAGIDIARASCPKGRFEVLAADSRLLENLGEQPFDLVYSLEVIEHLYDPRSYLAGCFAATRKGGRFICSTPYHGYLKNLALSLANAWDHHHDPLFDGGHIKFFSRATLSSLIAEVGFIDLGFHGSGRFQYLWKSMFITAIRP
jgi:SAM-dependent methyltransferase